MPQDAKDNELPSNAPDLTAAEQKALEGFDSDGKPIAAEGDDAAAAAAAAAAGTAVAAAVTDASAATAAQLAAGAMAAVDVGAATTTTVETPPAASTSPIYTPTVSPGQSRDFAAELKALKDKYGEGEVDDDQYEAAREQIIEDRTKFSLKTEMASEFGEQAWQANVAVFLRDPSNAALARSPEMRDLWQPMMQRAVNEAAAAGKVLSDWETLVAGRDLLFKTIGISPEPKVAVVAAPTPPAKPNQAPNLTNVPPNLARAPSAAQSGAKVTAETLSGSDDIMEIEQYMAGLSEAQADELLRGLPGAFVG